MYECMDDFIGVNQYELRLSKGDNVRVLSKNQNGLWYVLDSKGKAGWVPGDNLKLMAKSDQTESLVDSSRISDTVVCKDIYHIALLHCNCICNRSCES